MLSLLRRYKTMVLVSLFFFYIGCGITLSFLRLECVTAVATKKPQEALSSDVEYAVLILSSPDNKVKRDAIRITWKKLSENIFIENGEKLYKWNQDSVGTGVKHEFVKFFFAVGTQGLHDMVLEGLRRESQNSNDMLLLDFLDRYEYLTSKLINAMKWISANLKGLKYVIKCDDDSFVRIDLIIKDLDAYAPEMNGPELSQYVTFKKTLPSYKGLYWGYFDGRATARLSGKWQEKDWFLCDSYLPYALGGGYIISRSIVDYIARNADFLSVYNSEDVSMGVWTAALDGINRVHDTRFDTEWKSRGCSKHMLVRHKQTPPDMLSMNTALVNSKGETLCKTESVERKSYSYKWDVLPSMCCK
ncbi:beta-1,3-galactosyltransferase 6 [Ostrinia nubilalis]|uniref:beta-1,3-galactosyltransferase 6 n=1 Tax=Ostrinia nubilalis TaxID=29057 RepID=UPI00308240B7